MIRYAINKGELEKLIEAESPGWLAKAEARTAEFRKKGVYAEESSIWSAVKPVYMRLQGNGKCAYCEREMESVPLGKIEQDVEHFRPKGSVKGWKMPSKPSDTKIAFTAAPKKGKGYYLLPYHPFNYAAACKPCNSTLKKDYFPIAGTYNLDAEDPTKLSSEEPYLIYPIGSLDDDPEDLIEFHGVSPFPVARTGHKRSRALVTIEFFKLDDPEKRKNLYRDRALIIMAVFTLLQQTRVGASGGKAAAQATVDGFLKPQLRHLNCAKSFRRLFDSNSGEAQAIFDRAVRVMTSMS